MPIKYTMNPFLPISLSTSFTLPFSFSSALEQTWRVDLVDGFLYVHVCMKLLLSLQSYSQEVCTQCSVIQNSCHGIYLLVITMPSSGMPKCIELPFLGELLVDQYLDLSSICYNLLKKFRIL